MTPETASHADELRLDPDLVRRARDAAASEDVVGAGLRVAAGLADAAGLLGTRTLDHLRTLAALAAGDLTVARVVEPHLDALAILAQAGGPDLSGLGVGPETTWGVFAANAPGHGLTAHKVADGVRIEGSKAWCSLADRVSHALVTADGAGGTGLYAVPLRHPGVSVDSRSWVSRGLAELTTSTMTCTDVPALPVGGPGWYLERPGFAWGGIAVAAVWYGGALAVASALQEAAGRREPDQIALAHVGRVDLLLTSARLVLQAAADDIDAGRAVGADGAVLALRVRSIVADAAEQVMATVGHALGPYPLTQVEAHARAVADLSVYIRQHHAERDLAALGRHLLDAR